MYVVYVAYVVFACMDVCMYICDCVCVYVRMFYMQVHILVVACNSEDKYKISVSHAR